MIYAVYRCLYGEDFVQESIKSIDPYVDRIFIFWDDTPWGNITSCNYKGVEVQFPTKFDNILGKILELNNPKIKLIYNHVENNENQFTELINDYILEYFRKPDLFIIPEVDHVFRKDQLEKALDIIDASDQENFSTFPIELWKEPRYRIPQRRRLCTVFWKMKNLEDIHPTHRQADSCLKPINLIDAYTHNFGFCFNPQTMYWKHLTALGFSQKIGDSPPNPDWYDKWLNWTPETTNLEISLGSESNIPFAYGYDVNELPELIKEKYKYV